jgi:predicted DNA-binding transcriptional regulator AlpA
MAQDRFLTLAEVQKILGIGKTKMYELINSGEMETIDIAWGPPKPPRPVGKPGPRASRRIRQSDLDAYIKRNRAPVP